MSNPLLVLCIMDIMARGQMRQVCRRTGSAFLFSHLDLFVVPIALLVGGRLMYFVVSMWVAGWGRTCGETAEGVVYTVLMRELPRIISGKSMDLGYEVTREVSE